jgi:hypothetical protein
MAGKKKTMEGGKNPFSFDIFRPRSQKNTNRLFSEPVMKTPTTYNENKKQYSNVIDRFTEIKINDLSTNTLNTKVKSLIKFSEFIKNKKELIPSLDAVKYSIIKKIIEKIKKNNKITFAELLDLLIIFKDLSNNLSNQIESSKRSEITTNTNLILARLQTQLLSEIAEKTDIQDLNKLLEKLGSIKVSENGNTILTNNIEHLKYILNQRIDELQKTRSKQTNNHQNIFQQTGPNQTNPPQNNFQQTGLQQNSSQQFQVNNRPKKLIQSLNNAQKVHKNPEEIQYIANQIFELLNHKFDLAIKFLDTIGNSKRIEKGINNSLVNNAVVENKDLAKNIHILYDLWIELLNKYSTYLKPANKLELQKKASIIEDKKEEYSQKILEKQKYVIYT